jgi:predicted transcriptional regulator
MAKKEHKDIAALIAEETAAMESALDVPVPDSAVTRGHGRSKTLQVRLNPEELEELERFAAARGLPTSTVAREAILRLINPEASRSAAASRVVDDFARYIDMLAESKSPQLSVDVAVSRFSGRT